MTWLKRSSMKPKESNPPKHSIQDQLAVLKIAHLIGNFFRDEPHKVSIWMKTVNPLLGDITPIDMINNGRVQKLLKFVETQIAENKM